LSRLPTCPFRPLSRPASLPSGIDAEAIQLAAEIGLVEGSIEDATGAPDRPIYDFNHAVE
jgi:hypothetical protein